MTNQVLPFSTATQAYGQARPITVRAVSQIRPIAQQQPRDSLDISAAARAQSQPTARLAAARVPGQVDFTAASAPAAPGAMPIYTHPADRNAAATGVTAGRLIDTHA